MALWNDADAIEEMGHSLFFFFQAEDGIRDYKVTGVQTCALPIFDSDQYDVRGDHYATDKIHYFGRYSLANFNKNSPPAFGIAGGPSLSGLNFARSEERRVGKECRSRWSPYH